MEVTAILCFFIVGCAAGLIYNLAVKRTTGRFVNALIKIDATAPETAVTPEKIGVPLNGVLRYALNHGNVFRETVGVTQDGRFYIDARFLARAKTIYRDDGHKTIVVLALLLVALAAALVACIVYPAVISYVESVFNSIFGITE